MNRTRTRNSGAARTQLTPAGQLAAAMERGASALVTGLAGGAVLLTETAALLSASRTRVLRVRPPYNLTSFMRQVAPSAPEDDDGLLEEAYNVLAVLDPAYDRIALLVEDAHLLPKTTLRYVETTLRSVSYLCVALVGQPELDDLLTEHGLNDLRKRLSFHIIIPVSASVVAAPIAPSITNIPAVNNVPPLWRRAGILGGVFGALCVGLIASQLPNFLPAGDRRSDAAQVLAPPANIQPKTMQDASGASAPPAVAEVATTPTVLEPVMLALSGGEFRMGSNDDSSERPPHVAVLTPFLLAEKAVTLREWQQCVDAKACPVVSKGKPDEPVTNVSWDDARGFVAWLSRSTMQPHRLPTEAEWEYAARAGTSTRYAWGDTMVPGWASCKGCGVAVSLQNPSRVDAYPPNAFGLYGMGGGAAEWVSDCWHRNYQGAPRNGSAPRDASDCRERVLRGGSWVDEASSLRVSSREYYDASVRYPTHGFRIARSR